jgi:hypothetical protein
MLIKSDDPHRGGCCIYAHCPDDFRKIVWEPETKLASVLDTVAPSVASMCATNSMPSRDRRNSFASAALRRSIGSWRRSVAVSLKQIEGEKLRRFDVDQCWPPL